MPGDLSPLPGEEWRTIEDWNRYMVSSLGRIYSERRKQVIRTTLNRYGYPQVKLREGGIKTTRSVHRCVLEAFVSKRPDGHCCNHEDGDKTNSSIANLAWVTHSENNRHAIRIGLKRTDGEHHPNAKLNTEAVKTIRFARYRGIATTRQLASLYRVSVSHIRTLCDLKSGRWTAAMLSPPPARPTT